MGLDLSVWGSGSSAPVRGTLIYRGNQFRKFTIGCPVGQGDRLFRRFVVENNAGLDTAAPFGVSMNGNSSASLSIDVILEANVFTGPYELSYISGQTIVTNNVTLASNAQGHANSLQHVAAGTLMNNIITDSDASHGWAVDGSKLSAAGNIFKTEPARLYTYDAAPVLAHPLVLTAAGPPSLTPQFTGQLYIDTGPGKTYIAIGISGPDDWRQMTN